MPLHLRCLGALVLEGPDDHPGIARARQRRQLALLAILVAARGQPVPRERLCGLLFAEVDDERARAQLSDATYLLRRALGSEAIVTVGDALQLAADALPSDLDAFEMALDGGDAAAALAAWGGPFLDGADTGLSPAFEPWVATERDRLRRRRREALAALADEAESRRDPIALAARLRTLVDDDPLDGATALRAMESLRAVGDPVAALRTARVHEAALRRELGVGPAPAIVALARTLQQEATRAPAAPPAPRADPVAIAMLPLHDLSPGADDPLLATALTDEIIRALGTHAMLRVAARSSVFAWQGRHADVREVGAQLGVAYVVEGTLRRQGDGVRLAVQLADVATGFLLWSDAYDVPLEELVGLDRAIAGAVARQLGAVARTHAHADPTGEFPREAVLVYFRGRAALVRASFGASGEGLVEARDALETAVRLAPRFAPAHAALAQLWSEALIHHVPPHPDPLGAMEAAAGRALALAPASADAILLAARARFSRTLDWRAVDDVADRVLALAPSDADAKAELAWYRAWQSRHEEALALLRDARRLDPLSPAQRVRHAYALYWADRHEEALAVATAGGALPPLLHVAGLALLALGRPAEARVPLTTLVTLQGTNPVSAATLAVARARDGDERAARHWIASQEEALAAMGDGPPGMRGMLAAGIALARAPLGDATATLDALERAAAERAVFLVALDGYEPFDTLRGVPRFEALRTMLGLPVGSVP